MPVYLYEGPVMRFGKTVNGKWKGATFSISKEKALSNLSYKCKKEMGYDPKNSRVELDESYLTEM